VRRLTVAVFSLLNIGATHTAANAADYRAIAQRSEAIVVARCTEAHTHWDAGGRVIVTDLTLDIERLIKGETASTIVVRTLGGRIGRTGMGASHAATFAPGDRMVALLRRSRFGSYFVVTSAEAGSLAVVDRPDGAHVTVGNELIDLDSVVRQLEMDAQ
jgi:hypothetical protein